MFGTRSLDDLRYFHERAEQSRRAAQRATDPSARVAHEQLAKFYEARLASTMETAALQNSDTILISSCNRCADRLGLAAAYFLRGIKPTLVSGEEQLRGLTR